MTAQQKKQYHKDHAVHNNGALKVINKNGKFLDWSITICFYTCLHAVKHKSFPLSFKVGSKTVQLDSFEGYCQYTADAGGSKHSKLCDLLNNHYTEIASQYEHLMDMCMTARYHNYQVDREDANFAIELKEHIYNYCIDPEVAAAETAQKK